MPSESLIQKDPVASQFEYIGISDLPGSCLLLLYIPSVYKGYYFLDQLIKPTEIGRLWLEFYDER